VKIGISCYPTHGGSGVVATELGIELARRGHEIHFISYSIPFRLKGYQENVFFHEVQVISYPLFQYPPYTLALSAKMAEIADEHGLDVLHAHYAIPHAVCAYLARQVAASTKLRVATTLHGTDITLVGSDPSYSEIVAFSIDQSDLVTAVSKSLRTSTYEQLGVRRDIVVIPNFLDCGIHRRQNVGDLRRRFTADDPDAKIVIHVSNFRPVKRIDAVIGVFDRIRKRVPARLLLVGDGPELITAYRLARECGISQFVHSLGAQEEVVPLLSIADLFLLPSAQESFGLAALEAMACEVPVVASRVGGLPEVIDHGVTGFLHPPDELDEMAESGVMVLTDPVRHRAIAQAACARVREDFCAEKIVPIYEESYQSVVSKG